MSKPLFQLLRQTWLVELVLFAGTSMCKIIATTFHGIPNKSQGITLSVLNILLLILTAICPNKQLSRTQAQGLPGSPASRLVGFSRACSSEARWRGEASQVAEQQQTKGGWR